MADERRQQPGWWTKVDFVALVVGAAALIPGVSLHVLLWSEHLTGLGIYDPAIGADPSWRGRPIAAPLVVLSGAIFRVVVLDRIWLMIPRLKKAYVAIALVALASLLASLVPSPNYFG